MKNNMMKSGLLALMWLVYTLPAFAGPGDPPAGDDPPFEDPTPIDRWELLLIIAAIAVGTYFLLKFRRKAIV